MANYSNRRVYWATQETIADWVSSDDNTAGYQDLATDGVLMCGHPSRGQTLLWTTTDLWTMTYQGGEFVFGFARVGNHCGIISPLAAVVLDTAAYWWGVGKFHAYDGFVRTLPCEVQDYVFTDFATDYAHTVWALANPTFNEITWFYPSSGATTPDRYVTFNYVENHWTVGTLDRSAGVTVQAGSDVGVPVLIDSTGVIYDHETGTARTGQTVYLERGPMEVGDGDTVQRIQRIVPDDLTEGDVTATLYASLFPNAAETTHGPYTLASPTSVRLTARQVRIKLTEAVASAWRVGVIRLGAIAGGRR
jgi:hypothetical protein